MIVRERRRISSLARTASSLDEKVQEAEAAAAAKDAAFRAYVDEQRHEAATLAQNHQEQILSLMNIVREEIPGVEGECENENQYFEVKHIASCNPSEGKGNPKLLLLANERILVLERQLNELKMGHEAIRQHREREEEARSQLDMKTLQCNELLEEMSDLRSALRQIRDSATRPEGDVVNAAPKMESDSNHLRILEPILGIVNEALHPRAKSPSISTRRRRSSIPKKTEASHPLSPRLRRHADLMHTSDSDEVPDWAEDIMADLAIIAEGKIPLSLKEVTAVVDAEGRPGNQDVFDRLANPESFTGTQKQKASTKNGTKPRQSSDPTGQRNRKIISKQVADSLNKVIVPSVQASHGSVKKATSTTNSKRSVFDRLLSPSNLTGTQKQKFQDKSRRDRSTTSSSSDHATDAKNACPSKLHEGNAKIDYSTGTEADRMLDDLLSCDDDCAARSVGESTHSDTGGSASSRLESYTQLNVFERLNKTTTQAYAVKQNANIAEKMLRDLLDVSESKEEVNPKLENASSGFERVDEYAQRNVFERLQKTTTQAYAVKQNTNIAEKMLDDILDNQMHSRIQGPIQAENGSPNRGKLFEARSHALLASSSPSRPPSRVRNRSIGSPSDDVFERLQRTTTEAYASKMNRPLEPYSQHGGSEPNNAASYP